MCIRDSTDGHGPQSWLRRNGDPMTPRPLSRTLLPLFALAALIGTATHASAQVDPLLALKRLPPNVIIVMDTSFPMLSDGNGNFYDPKTYTRTDDTFAANALGVTAAQYRRCLLYTSPSPRDS